MAIILRLKAGSPNGLTEAPAGAMQASNRRRRLLASRRGGYTLSLQTNPSASRSFGTFQQWNDCPRQS